jgi:hypothetical protein
VREKVGACAERGKWYWKQDSTRYNDCDLSYNSFPKVRENTEGEYSGLEHEVVEGVVESSNVGGWGGRCEEAGGGLHVFCHHSV